MILKISIWRSSWWTSKLDSYNAIVAWRQTQRKFKLHERIDSIILYDTTTVAAMLLILFYDVPMHKFPNSFNTTGY